MTGPSCSAAPPKPCIERRRRGDLSPPRLSTFGPERRFLEVSRRTVPPPDCIPRPSGSWWALGPALSALGEGERGARVFRRSSRQDPFDRRSCCTPIRRPIRRSFTSSPPTRRPLHVRRRHRGSFTPSGPRDPRLSCIGWKRIRSDRLRQGSLRFRSPVLQRMAPFGRFRPSQVALAPARRVHRMGAGPAPCALDRSIRELTAPSASRRRKTPWTTFPARGLPVARAAAVRAARRSLSRARLAPGEEDAKSSLQALAPRARCSW